PTCVSIGSILRDSHLDRQKKPGPLRQGRPSSCSSSETQNARRPPAKAARQQEENLMFISIRTQSIRLWTVIALLALIGLSVPSASAQVTYDTNIYKQMVDASSSSTIPPGTEINLDNWTRYKAFMPLFLQVLFAGQYPIKFGREPEYKIKVGPTENYPYISQYAKDTEKYFAQSKLVPVQNGSYTISPP